jgi:hypothetical protein
MTWFGRYRTQEVAGSSPASSTHKSPVNRVSGGTMQCRTPCLIYLRATKLSRELPEPISPLRPGPDPHGYALRDVRKAPDVRGGAGPVPPIRARSTTPSANAAYAARQAPRPRTARLLLSSTLSGAVRGCEIAQCARAFPTSRGSGPDRTTERPPERTTERTTERTPERTPERTIPSSRRSRTVMPPA